MNNNIINKVLKASLFTGLFSLLFLFSKNQSTKEFYLDYLSVYGYFISLSIGATFFILLMNLTRAGWGCYSRDTGTFNEPAAYLCPFIYSDFIWHGFYF